MVDKPQPDRRTPVPGILKLPGYLLQALAPRTRYLAIALMTATAVALTGLTVVLVPRIADDKRDTRERDRAARTRAAEDERIRLEREQRPRSGRAASTGLPALETAIERAIVADIARRRSAGRSLTAAQTGRCRTLPVKGSAGTRLFACTAVTSDAPSSLESVAVSVGYPYRALGDPANGRFTICKVAGQPGEGSYRRNPVSLPRRCGG